MSTREEQLSNIVDFAAWLEAHPEVPIPADLTGAGYVLIHARHSEDPRAAVAAVARALPGKVDKSTYSGLFQVEGRVCGITVKAIAERDLVCERVVTGTREVKKTIPDPMVTVPVIEVVETVEDVEWRCGPLLAAVEA